MSSQRIFHGALLGLVAFVFELILEDKLLLGGSCGVIEEPFKSGNGSRPDTEKVEHELIVVSGYNIIELSRMRLTDPAG